MKYDNQEKIQGVDKSTFGTLPESQENNVLKFSSAFLHELRNPLTNIMLSVEALNDRLGNNSDDQIYLDIIGRGAKRINSLIDSILKSKESEETKQIEYPLHRLLDEVLEMAGDRINIKDIAVRKHYESQDFRAIMNEPEMKIALTNIIINAVDAMTKHNGQLSVVTKSITGGDRFVIEIQDNGYGIGKKNLKNIFTSHFTTKRIGLGFGLAATYDILRANHVGISVKSKEGSGTCFTLLFNNA